MGFTQDDLAKPVIGIAQTWSEFNNCNAHFKQVAEAVKRGVWQEGGLPLEFPTISLGEVHVQPTTMLFRNLMAMDTEEMIRAQPMDAVVLLAACDKTTPAALMGAALNIAMFLAFARIPVAIVLLCFYLYPALVTGSAAFTNWAVTTVSSGIMVCADATLGCT